MAEKSFTLKNCDAAHAKMLRDEIGKVRCWLTGFGVGRQQPGGVLPGIPGEDALRQIQVIIDSSL